MVSLPPAPWSARETLVGAGQVSPCDKLVFIGVESTSKFLCDHITIYIGAKEVGSVTTHGQQIKIRKSSYLLSL